MSGYTTCPKCQGADCGLCGGIGEVRADVAVDYLERQVSA